MTNIVQKLGDTTSHEVKPDFESGKGYYWMKQIREAQEATSRGETVHLPRHPDGRNTLAKSSFFEQVDKRLSRRYSTVNVSFDENGKIIKE